MNIVHKLTPMERTEDLRRNILIYRLLLIFGANGLMTTVIYFFFTSVNGLSPVQALFLVGLVVLTKALSEVPTGVIADKFSRKYSIFIGYVIALIGWIGILLATGFGQMFLFCVVIGIGSSFISGADDALLYDSLRELKTPGEFKSVYNLSSTIELTAFAVTVLLGGLLGNINLHLPLLTNIVFLAFSVTISLLLVEPDISEKGEEIEQVGYLLHTKKSLATIFSSSGVRNGLFGSFVSLALILAIFKSTKNVLSPILDQYGLAVSSIGLTVSLIILIKAFGAFIASKVSKHGNEIKEVLIGLGICIGGLLLITFVPTPSIQLCVFIIIIGFDNVITGNLNTIVNDRIESMQRSTILSLLSLFARSTEMLFLTCFGAIINLYPFKTALLFIAGWLLLATLVLSVSDRKIKYI